jgi:hypothetical protein
MISAIPTRRTRSRGDAKSRRGAVLMVAMIFVLVFAIAAASILTLSMTSYRMTMRNDMQAQARAVAETELEYVYYQFYLRCKYGKPAVEVPNELASIVQTHTAPSDHTPINPSAEDNPFPAFLLAHRNAGWRVGRSMVVTAGPVYGYIPANLMSAYGATSYVDAKIEVRPPANSPYANTVVVRVGRQFFDYAYAIFQHAVFYQGDLELYPGASLTINGDVVANGSIYMGSTGATINLTGKVSYLHNNYYNTALDGLEHLAKPNTPAELIGLNTSPTFTDSRDHQLTEMQQAEDLLGGADPDLLHTTYPDLFPTVNDVYRAALVPPPEAVGGICDEYPTWTATMADAPEISSQRIYNRAGLRVMVNSDGSFTVTRPVDPTNLASGYVTTSDFNSAIVGTSTIWDSREGREVTITTIDVAQLKTALDANDPVTGVPRGRSFNGILYVYLKHGTADQPSAIRLKNGATLPLSGAQQRTGLGVATNGGIYVQGDYNTTRLPNGTVMPDGTTL